MDEEDKAARKRRLAKERQQRCRARLTQESVERFQSEHNYVKRTLDLNETPEQSQEKRSTEVKSTRQLRAQESPGESQAHRAADMDEEDKATKKLRLTKERPVTPSPAESQARCAADLDEEDKAAKKRRLTKERQQRWRARQSEEAIERLQNKKKDAESTRHLNETPEQSHERRSTKAEAKRQLRAQESPIESQARRAADLETHHFTQTVKSQKICEEAIHFVEENIDEHSCGPLNVICQFCKSRNFISERPADRKFTSCCRKGKVNLPKPVGVSGLELQYPDFLRELLSKTHDSNSIHFRENIRSYNSAVSFASMGAKIVDLPGRGPYVFKIHGQTYHRTSHLQPHDHNSPQFAQLYVLDSTQATSVRQEHPANSQCLPEILDQIDRYFRQHNRIAASYQMMREIVTQSAKQAIETGQTIPTVSMIFRRDRHSDQRRYNAPTSNEIAMIFVNDTGEPPFERDIRIYPRNPQNPSQEFININILSPNLDPMCYALLFPFGQPGWQSKWQCQAYEGAALNRVRHNVSMLQYKTAQTAIRDNFNPIMSAGKLTQQWIVDSYLQVEANNLNFIRLNQQALRAECYQGLADHVAHLAQNEHISAGVAVILPSTFEGSPRNMRERCNDAMSIFAKWGAPDVFVTFTANPNWVEIKENLNPGEQCCDRPDLVARVFKIKLKSIICDLTFHGIFGESTAFVYTIEFQKRGLPHAHILVTLRADSKFTTPERIDQFISAEIPDPIINPRLHEIVTKCMMHGPCGTNNQNAPCMEDGICKKQFPKTFSDVTLHNVNGYPLYRRRNLLQAYVRGTMLDNRHVIPYSPYLLLKYNAHINVEICTSLRAVKYIYKYIYKGFDCANIAITAQGDQELRYNEINQFIDARYVSAPEAMWRLLENKMHDRSHSVMRLPVHLPNQQRVTFEAGHEEEALLAAQTGKTKLHSWFDLNLIESEARQFLYVEIPYHYVYVHGNWQRRKTGSEKIVARMYTVGLKDEERFYLRLLLLHVRAATSFVDIRTFNGNIMPSFKEAAAARGLLDSDEEWERCLTEAATYQMPKQFRETFAFICCYCQPANPPELWNRFEIDFTLDYLRQHPENEARNRALHDLNEILSQHGLSCAQINLPLPTHIAPDEEVCDPIAERNEANRRIRMLNEKQLEAFNKVVTAIDDSNITNRSFYLDGPGGSGKTFIYTTLICFIRGRSHIVLPFATTGIAATLLKGGRTVHSGFKLPVPLLDTSVSSMRLTSPEASILRQAKLIIVDEVTMLPKDGLRCIDKLLKEVMCTEKPFGGKVFVIGGDFRQTLPVVSRGTRTDVIESCIKSSRLWDNFEQLTLTSNMRSENQNEHNDWLLSIGIGNHERVEGIRNDETIEIPKHMIEKVNLIKSIFGSHIDTMSVEDLAKRVIIAPTNIQTLEMNRAIIDLIRGDPQIYYSADSVISEDPTDAQNFPVEFLNDLTPSGMPPHVLVLKIGVILMLLRNLNPKKGLCNGTRMIVRHLQRHFITAEIISDCNRGDIVFIPRIDLAPTDTTLPFILKRRQFPVIPAYAITINKSQGQTFDHVGIALKTAVFSHGQLYVALSRSRNPNQIKIQITEDPQQGQLLQDDREFTRNVVFREVFQM